MGSGPMGRANKLSNLTSVRRVVFGPVSSPKSGHQDVTARVPA